MPRHLSSSDVLACMMVFRGTRLWHVCDGTSVALGISLSAQPLLLLATSSPVVVADRRTPLDRPPQSTLALVSTNGCRPPKSCLDLTPPPPTVPLLSNFFLFCDVLNRFQLSALIKAECFFKLFSSVPLCCCCDSPPVVAVLQLFSELLLLWW